MSALPRTLGNMANLRELRVNDNQLTALPPSIREAVKLEKVRFTVGCVVRRALFNSPRSCNCQETRSKFCPTTLSSSRA